VEETAAAGAAKFNEGNLVAAATHSQTKHRVIHKPNTGQILVAAVLWRGKRWQATKQPLVIYMHHCEIL
jgi:hypothetical protein